MASAFLRFVLFVFFFGGGGSGVSDHDIPYERDRDARWNIGIKTLKDTNLGVAQALFEP